MTVGTPGSPSGALAGCLLGQALGDALGFVVEAAHPESVADYVSGCLRSGRAGDLSHPDFPFGQYSDDTQMARELLCGIRDYGGWDPATFARRIAALFGEGREVGAGPGTRSTAERLRSGVSWREAGRPAPYDGNGSAMRAGPVGVVFGGGVDRMLRVAAEQSLITHRDPRCTAGAVAVAGAAALAAGGPVDTGAFIERLAAWAGREDQTMAAAIRSVADWVDLEPAAAARHLHESGLDPARTDQWMGISSSVVPSVTWSLYAFVRSPDDYWETICVAIGAGGDTDTMAAMAGAISGARLGAEALPRDLLARVNDRGTWGAAELTDLAGDCDGLGRPTAS